MNGFRNAAEGFYTSHSNYGSAGAALTNCGTGDMVADTSTGLANLVATSTWPDGVSPTCVNNATPTSDATQYAAWHVLSDGTTYWCVDSSGIAKSEPSAPVATATVCP